MDGRNAPGYAFDEVRLICEERKRELAAAARFRDGLKVGCVRQTQLSIGRSRRPGDVHTAPLSLCPLSSLYFYGRVYRSSDIFKHARLIFTYRMSARMSDYMYTHPYVVCRVTGGGVTEQ